MFVHYIHKHLCNSLARGDISQSSSGVLVALLDQAQQLDPDANPPVVALETANKYFHLKYHFEVLKN